MFWLIIPIILINRIIHFQINPSLICEEKELCVSVTVLFCKFTRVLIVRLHVNRMMWSYAASMRLPILSRVDEGILFFSSSCSMGGTVFMELDQPKLVFTILCQRVHSSREPVPLLPEQVDFCLQGLDVSLTIFVVLAKRIRKSISVMYYALEFLLCLSMVFYDFLQLIHQATVGNLLFLTLTLFPIPGS